MLSVLNTVTVKTVMEVALAGGSGCAGYFSKTWEAFASARRGKRVIAVKKLNIRSTRQILIRPQLELSQMGRWTSPTRCVQ